ncbi:hypothetical protein MSG28_003884 [Choristoneura fumiferana]|uniref:Uncharacterized protein n=1 Tax=Choristoneura fumiferana TaxID=7141 RepID=A0ACC0KGR2_CHOFU|nr:hypothetical protein MSG28_003884 [Choristoneura fumiferana]
MERWSSSTVINQQTTCEEISVQHSYIFCKNLPIKDPKEVPFVVFNNYVEHEPEGTRVYQEAKG